MGVWKQITLFSFCSLSKTNYKAKIGKVEKTDPRSADYPLTPLRGLPYGLLHGLLHGLLPRTTLNNQPNYFYGEEKHKKPTCSHVHDHNLKQPPFSFHRLSRPSLFHFRPILHRPPASETLFPHNMFSTLNWRLSLIVNFLSIYYYRYSRTLKAWYGLWEMNRFLLKAEP